MYKRQIYSDPADPMVNWDVEDLLIACQAAGLEIVESESEGESAERRITEADLKRWFAPAPAGERLSYADHLLKAITPAEMEQVQPLFERQLKNQIVTWASTTLYLVTR